VFGAADFCKPLQLLVKMNSTAGQPNALDATLSLLAVTTVSQLTVCELFKKTLPSASSLQLKKSSPMLKQQALAALQEASQGDKHDFRINLVSLALKGKKVSRVVHNSSDLIL
jgi:hypothetical protein